MFMLKTLKPQSCKPNYTNKVAQSTSDLYFKA